MVNYMMMTISCCLSFKKKRKNDVHVLRLEDSIVNLFIFVKVSICNYCLI